MIFSLKNQIKFAEISQDFNPIHINEVLARRYIFGEPVVHGINAMIFAIKEWSQMVGTPFFIKDLRCKFKKPIFLNEDVSIEINNTENFVKIVLIQDNDIKVAIDMSILETTHSTGKIKDHDSRTDHAPNDISFEKLNNFSHSIDCSLNIPLSEEYYSKDFVEKIGYEQLAEIISLSRIVGMHCPGLNSILSEVSLVRNTNNKDSISFNVKSLDERFNIVNVESSGPNYKSSIKAFYRPLKVKQKSIDEIKDNLQTNEFKDFRALIIGASRGLGEYTAKCLGYGGASMMLTYAKGKDDIIDVLNDIQNYNNEDISILKFDITNMTERNFEIINEFKPTHVFYFATPFIFIGSKNKFSKQKYNKFKQYYLDAFETFVRNLAKLSINIKFLYPSSSAITDEPIDMLEYTLAKKKGEELCIKLQNEFSKINFFCPRLPRLKTDQTVSLSFVENKDPIEILDTIRLMKKN